MPIKKKLRSITVLLYLSLIFILSSHPVHHKFSIKNIDKLIHLVEYFILSLLILRTIYLKNSFNWKQIFFCIFISTFYGITDEIHQYFVPTRSAEVLDVLADLLGSSCIILFKFFPKLHYFIK